MTKVSQSIHSAIDAAGEQRLLADWDRLDSADRSRLVDLLSRLDFALLKSIYSGEAKKTEIPPRESISYPPLVPQDADLKEARRIGETALRANEVSVVVVAGGRGTRLGFDAPKGVFPIGPATQRTLFQIHAEKVLALRRKYCCDLPFLIMTSDATDADTRDFFARNQNFGLGHTVHFFQQDVFPVINPATGRPVLDGGKLVCSPNGHGGTLFALHRDGWLDRWTNSAVKHLFYFQVDNPLARIADPEFVGVHIQRNSEASTKVVRKAKPTDRMGNAVMVNDRKCIIEYSDLTTEQAEWTDDQGRQLFIWGNTGIHVFSIAFLSRLISSRHRMPLHIARKNVQADGTATEAVQFEMFIFDILPESAVNLVVETTHTDEFAPLKNREGSDSPKTVRQAMVDLYGKWLETAGMRTIPGCPIEISPLAALEQSDITDNRSVVVLIQPRLAMDES